jgi:hypothetical protein
VPPVGGDKEFHLAQHFVVFSNYGEEAVIHQAKAKKIFPI